MAIKDSIRDAGVAESQNFALLEVLMVASASGTPWQVALASKGAAGKVYVVENAAIPSSAFEKIFTMHNGDLSNTSVIKAANLSTYFSASATDIAFAVGGLAGLTASSVLSVEVELFSANGVKNGASVYGPADRILNKADLTIPSGDLVLDVETGTVIGKIDIGTLTINAADKAILRLRVKL